MTNSMKRMKQLFASSVPSLIVLALSLRCVQAQEESDNNNYGDDYSYEIDHADSFSCAIFAFFMWLGT